MTGSWTPEDAARVLRRPTAADDKYSRGVLGVRTGSTAYPGAAVLGVEAAWRTGLGMVRYLGPGASDRSRARPPPRDGDRRRARAGVADRVGHGCRRAIGCRDRGASRASCRDRIRSSSTPARSISRSAPPAPRIVTPHAREHARLRAALGLDDADPASEDGASPPRARPRRRSGRRRAEGRGDGGRPPDGWTVLVEAGTPWLATAGTGDVLAGVIGALVAAAAARERRRRMPHRSRRRSPRPARGCTGAPRRLAAARIGPRGGPDHGARRRRGAAARGRRGARRPRDAARRGAGSTRARLGLGCRGGRCCGWRSSSCSRRRRARLPDAEPADGRRLPRLRAVGARRARRATAIAGIDERLGVPAARAAADAPRAGPGVDRRLRGRPGRSWSPRSTRSRSRCWSAVAAPPDAPRPPWFWLAYPGARSGRSAMYRIDAVTVPLAVAGCLWLVGRPWIASVLLAVATWIKVWPAALLAAALIAVRRRGAIVGGALRRQRRDAVRWSSRWAAAAHAFGLRRRPDRARAAARGAGQHVLPVARGRRIDGSFVYYDRDLLTFQVTGPERRRRDRRR